MSKFDKRSSDKTYKYVSALHPQLVLQKMTFSPDSLPPDQTLSDRLTRSLSKFLGWKLNSLLLVSRYTRYSPCPPPHQLSIYHLVHLMRLRPNTTMSYLVRPIYTTLVPRNNSSLSSHVRTTALCPSSQLAAGECQMQNIDGGHWRLENLKIN